MPRSNGITTETFKANNKDWGDNYDRAFQKGKYALKEVSMEDLEHQDELEKEGAPSIIEKWTLDLGHKILCDGEFMDKREIVKLLNRLDG